MKKEFNKKTEEFEQHKPFLNKNQTLLVIFSVIGSIIILGGLVLIYDILTPPVPISSLSSVVVFGIPFAPEVFNLLLIMLGLSWIIHGFQIRLLA